MLTVDEATARLTAAFSPLDDYERVPLLEAMGRVLVEDVPADVDLPPFDNTAMDGYAVRAADVAGATRDHPVAMPVLGEVAAGRLPDGAVGPGQAYRILTGAPLPAGADSIVPYEYTDGQGFGGWSGSAGGQIAAAERRVRVFRPVEPGENVRYTGEDQKRGEVVLRAGTVVRPYEVGGLAALGRTEVWVRRRPRVAILSTGDEVVPVDAPLGPGQIRNANTWSLMALVRHYGGEATSLGIARDEVEAVRERLLAGVSLRPDLLLTTGGVSMGDYDVVKRVIGDEGEVAFWSVDVRPGKPLAYGRLQGVPLLALPGNPVSTIVTFELFVRPVLLRLAGHTRLRKVALEATALHPITNSSGRENFMRGIVSRRAPPGAATEAGGDGAWVVRLTGEQGSNILTSVVKANALVRVPKSRPRVEAGERVTVWMLDWPPQE
jgi:molybdopterin molybdotransferase